MVLAAVVVVLAVVVARTDVCRVDATAGVDAPAVAVAVAVAVAGGGDATVLKVDDANGVPTAGGALW